MRMLRRLCRWAAGLGWATVDCSQGVEPLHGQSSAAVGVEVLQEMLQDLICKSDALRCLHITYSHASAAADCRVPMQVLHNTRKRGDGCGRCK